jgi:hypothetical protein
MLALPRGGATEQPAGQPRSTRGGNGARRTLTRCPSGGLHTLGRPLLLRFSDGVRRSGTMSRTPGRRRSHSSPADTRLPSPGRTSCAAARPSPNRVCAPSSAPPPSRQRQGSPPPAPAPPPLEGAQRRLGWDAGAGPAGTGGAVRAPARGGLRRQRDARASRAPELSPSPRRGLHGGHVRRLQSERPQYSILKP